MVKLKAVKGFAEAIAEKYKDVVKAVWLVVEEDTHTAIVLLDDTSGMDAIAIESVKVSLLELARKIRKEKKLDFGVLFYLLTDYWALVRHGSPVTFAEIREGIPIYDPSGFFIPLKKLLDQGRIPGTKEAMKSLLEEAPLRLLRIERIHTGRIVEELSSAVIDAGQAPLLFIGVSPPVPRRLPEMLRVHFVKKGMLEPEYVRYCEHVIKYAKAVEHRAIKHITGEDMDVLLDKAVRFVERMEKLMRKLLVAQK